MTPNRQDRVEGRLAERPYQPGDPLPVVGSECLVSGANGDIESDQHRGYMWRRVIGYSAGDRFVCLQARDCWPTVERLANCWFAEVPTPRVHDTTPVAEIAQPATAEPLFLVTAGGDGYQAEIVPLSKLDDAYLLTQWGTLADIDPEQRSAALEHFHDPEEWLYMDPLRGPEHRVPVEFSVSFEDGWVRVVRLPDRATQASAATPAPAETPADAVARIVHLRASRERRIYIAGPMTGLPEYNFPAFNAAAEQLCTDGWHVENPAEHGHVEGAGWADYLRWDISRVATCAAVYLLPGWPASKGATLEVSIARALGLAIICAPGAEDPATPAAPPAAAPAARNQSAEER